jgi:hypothetical protein
MRLASFGSFFQSFFAATESSMKGS